MGKKILIALVVLSLIAVLAVWQRFRILLPLSTTGEPIPQDLSAAPVPGGIPFGESQHFSIVKLDETTYAISEPYSWARNVNYLIIGSARALLFDAGVGHFDIRPVVASLTDLPITFMPSHFHYDHTGQGDWANMAVVDLPHIRARADGDRLQPTWGEHLGSAEAIPLPVWQVDEWVQPNSAIDLGGRQLLLLYTPGHTDNSVSLFDVERELLFTGDFIADSGSIGALYPTASLGDYLQSAKKVLEKTRQMQAVVLRGAHASAANTIPANSRQDVQTLRDQLQAIKAGSLVGTGSYPVTYQIQASMVLNAEPGFLQNWEPTYPDGHAVH